MLTTACATKPPAKPDVLCEELSRFATTSDISRPRFVTLTVDWGGRFAKKPTIFEQNCQHLGYPPADDFCGYLTEHTSREFPLINASRVVSCLDPVARRRGRRFVDRESENWSVVGTTSQAPENVRVGVEYHEETDKAPATLVISVFARKDL
jgi:hypothetical protein